MILLATYCRELLSGIRDGWTRFWFSAQDPATLGLIRVLAGAMLFYTHLVWSLDLTGFFGPAGWLSPNALQAAYGDARSLFWSHWHWIESPAMIWTAHLAALVVFAMLCLGLFTRIVSVAAWLLTVSYAHRVMPAALFGLDDINAMLSMYLMVGPSGDAYSLDRWLAQRKTRRAPDGNRQANRVQARSDNAANDSASVGANIAIRLMQVHLCVIYLFSALGKGMGETWWDGSAMWLAVANFEYQSVDLTWLAASPALLSFFAHVTVAWELAYPALVWPRLSRPLVVAMCVPIHLGIAIFLGMMTFGLAMIIANLAFVSPWVVRALLSRAPSPVGQANAKEPRPALPLAP
jgi:hypothetical protein